MEKLLFALAVGAGMGWLVAGRVKKDEPKMFRQIGTIAGGIAAIVVWVVAEFFW
ncbi:hypothetical protein [Maritalea sp.]|jgi:hypothetical protein|uniref:hypothetical protein n=1 Tax=Maritalea sp. TaxID=2003361 RepID=UPI0039E60860